MVALRKTSLFIATTIAVLSSKHVQAFGQIAQVVDASNFCVFLPPDDSANRIISDTEWNAQAFCIGKTPLAKNAGKLKSGFIQSAHFVATDQYVQVTGQIDPSKARLNLTDEGGQMDVKAPKYSSCAGWKYYVNLIEPAGRTYCMRCCNDNRTCNRGISEKGCAHIIPGDYSGPYGNGPTSIPPPPATDNDENEDEDADDQNNSAVAKPTKSATKTVAKTKTASKTTKTKTSTKKSKPTTVETGAATDSNANADKAGNGNKVGHNSNPTLEANAETVATTDNSTNTDTASNDQDAGTNNNPAPAANHPIAVQTSNGRGDSQLGSDDNTTVPEALSPTTSSIVDATVTPDAKKGELLSGDGTVTAQSVNGASNMFTPRPMTISILLLTLIFFLTF